MRRNTKESNAWTNGVEMRFRHAQRSRAVRHVHVTRRKSSRAYTTEHLLKQAELMPRRFEIFGIRTREMRHESIEAHVRSCFERIENIVELRHAHAQTTHARVDFEMHAYGTTIAIQTRQHPETFDVTSVVDDRNEVAREDLFEALATWSVITTHHQDRNANACIPKFDGFLQQGHAQTGHASALQRARDSCRAMSVCIGLEHAPHGRRSCVCRGQGPFDDPEVVTEVREVHFGARRSNRVGWSGSSGSKNANRRAICPFLMTEFQAGRPLFCQLRRHVVCRYLYAPHGANIPTKIVFSTRRVRFVIRNRRACTSRVRLCRSSRTSRCTFADCTWASRTLSCTWSSSPHTRSCTRCQEASRKVLALAEGLEAQRRPRGSWEVERVRR